MKRPSIQTCFALAGLLLPLDAGAQQSVPAILPFQARLTDANGDVVPDGAKVVQFQVYNAPTGGAVEWAGEVHKLSVNGGLVNVLLGTKNSLAPVDFAKTLYLQITIDGNNDGFIDEADPPLLPRQIILPAFFARQAQDSRKLEGFDWDVVFGSANHPDGSGGGSPGFLPGSRIQSETVTSGQIQDGQVARDDIADDAINGDKIKDGTLTAADFEPGDIVSGGQITDGTITGTDIDSIPLSKISDGTMMGDYFHVLDYSPYQSYAVYYEARLRCPGTNATAAIRVAQPLTIPSSDPVPQISLRDTNGTEQVRIYATTGQGVIQADIKNFVVDHPGDPQKEIVYASLEGSEAGMYHRGTVQLEGGRATIGLPEHFSLLAAPGTLTVTLTPNSLDSKGLAVGSKSVERVEIGELMGGTGTYPVDFTVTAVRKGYEDYQPVRPKTRPDSPPQP